MFLAIRLKFVQSTFKFRKLKKNVIVTIINVIKLTNLQFFSQFSMQSLKYFKHTHTHICFFLCPYYYIDVGLH